VDENGLRVLLNQVSDDELPPVRVSIELAARTGRRRLRQRHLYLPGAAPLAAAAAVAVIVGLLNATGAGLHHGNTGPGSGTAWRTVPEQFSLQSPYASLGWLPPGFSTQGFSNQTSLTTTQLIYGASDGNRALTLVLYPARLCKITGAGDLMTYKTKESFPFVLGCAGAGNAGATGLYRSADVNSSPAYWAWKRHTLWWEYGKDAWAALSPDEGSGCPVGQSPCPPAPTSWLGTASRDPSAATQATLYRVAAGVRYGTYPQVRYGFTVSGLPTSWLVTPAGEITNITTIGRVLANTGWEAGPAADPSALNIDVEPTAGESGAFQAIAGDTNDTIPKLSGYIMIDGVSAAIYTLTSGNRVYEQYLSAPDVDGLQLLISLDLRTQGPSSRLLPGGRVVADLRALVSHVRLLGPNLARWATSPTRPAG
jgi:hypothetical protein